MTDMKFSVHSTQRQTPSRLR